MNLDELPVEVLHACIARASGGDFDQLCTLASTSPAFQRGCERTLESWRAQQNISFKITDLPVPRPWIREGVPPPPEPPQPLWPVISCSLARSLDCLKLFESVQCLDLTPAGPFLTDEHMEVVGSLQRISFLCLAHCRITDEGLVNLLRLPNLKALDLSHFFGSFDDELETLKHLESLEELKIRGLAYLKDAAVLPIARNLRVLDAYGTSVGNPVCEVLLNCHDLNLVEGFLTDIGLMSLVQGAPNLRRLVMCGPKGSAGGGAGHCSQECVEMFMQQRPEVSLIFTRGPQEVLEETEFEYDRADDYYYLPEELELREDA